MKKNLLTLLMLLFVFANNITAQNCTVNAGIDQTICVGSALTLTGVAGNPQSVPPLYQWTKLSGPAATITSPNATVTTVTGLTPGNYIFELSNRCSDNLLAKDIVAITVLPVPPTATAGPDITQCTNTAAPLNANAVSAPFIGTWTVSPVGGTFSPNANAPNATYTPPAGSATYTLTWTISNGTCVTSDAMLLRIASPPAVNAGVDKNVSCGGSCVAMTASSPGLTPPQSGFWTVISGPNTPVIVTPTSNTSQVCGLVPGSYTLRWTVSGPCLSGFDDVIINVANTFDPPVAQAAQSYTAFCGTPAVTTQTLNGTALTAGETGVWSQTSPASPIATFTPNNTVANVTVGNLTGTFPYVFTYVRTNAAGCTASSTHTIYRAPSVNNLSTPADRDLACDATSTTFTLSYDDLASVTNGLTRTGVRISGPAAVGSVSYTSSVAALGTRTDTWTATAMTTAGTYVFRMEYSNSCGSQYRDIAITVSRTPSIVNAGSNPILPCNTLTANPIGSGGGTGTYTWTQVSGPNTALLSGINTLSLTMGSLPSFPLVQGVYVIRLSISGGKTCPSKSDTMSVRVTTAVPTIATTGLDATICAGNVRLTANTPNSTETGTWTATPSAGVSFLPNANTPNAIAQGLAANTAYTFRWTVSNACGSIFDEQVLTTTAVQGPPVPNAGADICRPAGSTTTALNGSAPGSSTITWTALDAGSSVSSTNTQATTANITSAGTYRFEYALSVVTCTTLRDTVIVTVNQAISANAGADIDICAPTTPASATLTATAPPAGTTGSWSQLSGPASTTLATPNNNSTLINGFLPGIYEFEYRISTGGICADVTDIVVVRVVSEPSAAVAGPDQSVCNVTTATALTLAATPPAVGTGYWQVVSGPPGSTPTFSNQLLANSTISNLMNGTYTLRWTTTNGAGCADKTDDVVLSITATASARADINLCNAPSAILTGNANTTGTWTYVSGPVGSAIITNSPNTAVITGLTTLSPLPGVYTFRYSLPAVGACPATFDDMILTNYPTPSQANAGADVQLCFNTNTVTLTGNIPAVGTGTWVIESGPNSPTAGTGNATYQDTTLNSIVAGLYIYQYRVNTNAACVASVDKVQIIKERVAAAGTDIRVCNSATVNLAATAGVINAGTWSYVSGPGGSGFVNANAPNTAVTGMVPGTYIFRWTLSSPAPLGCAANFDDVQVIIDPAVPAMNAGNDVSFCEGTVAPFLIGSAVQPGVTYLWTPALFLDNTAIPQPTFSGVNNPGTYVYTVKGTIGTCEAFDAVTIKVNGKPSPGINSSLLGCLNTTFTGVNNFPGVAIASYSWNFGVGATPATASGIGPHSITYATGVGNKTITLTATTAEGCTNTTSKIIDNRCFTLPVVLSEFTAIWREDYTALNWLVSSALNFSHFEIERSVDGVQFNAMGQVAYLVNKTAYSYTDRNIPMGYSKLYYRLKLVDIDGNYAYSPIRVVFPTINESTVVIAPNPFTDKIGVWLSVSLATETIRLKLLGINGQVIKEKEVKLDRGNHYLDLGSLAGIAKGVYVLHIISSKTNTVKKVVKN
ncbi:MAG: T9SS type A sorting domain-containing protein [Chitinophagaceae bacterium]|nr:T9SS type A sorting domain-containing protein [Chitinophagaceae bacterium]